MKRGAKEHCASFLCRNIKKPRIYRGRVRGRKGCMLMSRLPALTQSEDGYSRRETEGK